MGSRALLAVALLLATACGGEAGGGGAGGLDGELRYTRSGGLAGVHEELVIQPDGRARLTVRGQDPEEFSLSEEELEGVASALEEAALDDIPADSTSDPAAPDAFTYVIEYEGREVRTDDPSAPSELDSLLGELDRIVSDHAPG